jgi:protein O-GlcNAc transferase
MAVLRIERATSSRNGRSMNPVETLQRAMQMHSAGNLSQAEELYNEVLSADARQFDVLHMLGILHCQRRNFHEAVAFFNRALEVRPQSVDALVNLGRAQSEAGDLHDAETSYLRALAINPRFVLALSNYSIVLRKSGRPEEAVAFCDKALALQPNHVLAINNRGNALFDAKRYDEALADYDRARALAPQLAQAWLGRANVCHVLRRFGDARAAIDKALSLNRHSPEAWLAYGNILSKQHDYDGALSGYDRALALDPKLADAWSGRTSVLSAQKRFPEMIAEYDKLLTALPDAPYALGHRLFAKMQICDWTDWNAECGRVLTATRRDRQVCEPSILLAIPATPADQLRCARTYASKHYPVGPSPILQGTGRVGDKIKVAYLSADFREHPVAYLLAGLIERHDRSKFTPIAVSLGSDDSDLRRRLKRAFDSFIDVDAQSDAAVVKQLRSLGVDIAVDLMGLTQESRPGILAARPAPVQVGYLGYAGTVGGGHLDYVLADHWVIPQEQRSCFSEHVVYLPHSFQPNDRRPIAERTPSREEAGLPEHGFVFCSFNQSFKITPDVFDVWMRLLSRIAGSVLWLQGGHPAAVVNLRAAAQRSGIDSTRIVFAARLPRNEDHLARHHLADVFLDTTPYNAHTSASDALWTGLPVVTCAGETFASRVAASLLHAVGLPELVTWSLAEYEALATKLAAEPDFLATLKARLATLRESCPLFDVDQVRRHVETAFTAMYERHLRGEPPQHFTVPPDEE